MLVAVRQLLKRTKVNRLLQPGASFCEFNGLFQSLHTLKFVGLANFDVAVAIVMLVQSLKICGLLHLVVLLPLNITYWHAVSPRKICCSWLSTLLLLRLLVLPFLLVQEQKWLRQVDILIDVYVLLASAFLGATIFVYV